MFRRFYPRAWVENAYDIDYEALYQKGIRGLIFDIDNTLVPHDAPPDSRSAALMKGLLERGFQVMTVSNNHEPRVRSLAEKLGIAYICDAGKPSPRGYLEACRRMGITPRQTACIGDQLFTDVLGANRAGIYSILVVPVDRGTDILRIRIKRRLEGPVLKEYKKQFGGPVRGNTGLNQENP